MAAETSFKSKLSQIQHKVGGSVESVSQQRIASQKPRGTKLDPSGTCINLKGARNYTPYSLSVGPDEMFEDIVTRGLRSDGLSTKLGIKNNKNLVADLVSGLLQSDPRHDETMRHFYRKRQRNNSAKNIFSTMTVDELKYIKKEFFPSLADGPERNILLQSLENNHDKVQDALKVLEDFQETLKYIIRTTELFSSHNFQTRGFFLDMFSATCNFISDLLVQGLDLSRRQIDARCNILTKRPSTKSLELSACMETMNENLSEHDLRIQSKNHYRQSNPTTIVVSSDKITSMNSDMTTDKNNDCITHDIANIEFEEDQDGEKGWIPIEIMQTGEKARMLMVKGSSKSHSLDNSNNNNIVNLMKNQETVVVECAFQPHDCLSSDKYKEIESPATLDLDGDHNTVDSGSSTCVTSNSFVGSKMSDESLETILSLGGGSTNKSYSPSETSLYLCTQETPLSNNTAVLHGETFIPIEIEMMHSIPHSTQENIVGSIFPSKRQKHTDSYNLD